MINNQYQAQDLKATPLKDFKTAGFSLDVYTAKEGYDYVEISKGDSKFIAITSKSFSGEVSLETFVVEGENKKGQPRLYLTNKSGGSRTKKASL